MAPCPSPPLICTSASWNPPGAKCVGRPRWCGSPAAAASSPADSPAVTTWWPTARRISPSSPASAAEMKAGTPFPEERDARQDGPMRRLRYTMALLVAVIVCGGLGYHWLSHLDPLDSLYMAITTLFTVCFLELREVNARTKLF